MKLLMILIAMIALSACSTDGKLVCTGNDDTDPSFCRRDVVNHQNMKR